MATSMRLMKCDCGKEYRLNGQKVSSVCPHCKKKNRITI